MLIMAMAAKTRWLKSLLTLNPNTLESRMYFEQIKMKRGLPFSVTLADDAELQAATPQAKGWPEGYFESLAAWEGEDIVRPDQGEYETRLEFD